MIARLFIIGCSLICFQSLRAQERKEVKHVKGEWVGSNDITPIQAREKAIGEAKTEALRQAGVPELIRESNFLYQTERSSKSKDFFQSLSSVDVSGEIADFLIVQEEKKPNAQGYMLYQVWIDATVVINHVVKDPGFDIDVAGIQESYTSPDQLTFKVTPWKNGYLNVFILADKECSQLYPNRLEKQQILSGKKTYFFPLSRALDYKVSTDTTLEINYLLLLYTKSEIPFQKEPTTSNILGFISGIDPSARILKSYPLIIRK